MQGTTSSHTSSTATFFLTWYRNGSVVADVSGSCRTVCLNYFLPAHANKRVTEHLLIIIAIAIRQRDVYLWNLFALVATIAGGRLGWYQQQCMVPLTEALLWTPDVVLLWRRPPPVTSSSLVAFLIPFPVFWVADKLLFVGWLAYCLHRSDEWLAALAPLWLPPIESSMPCVTQ